MILHLITANQEQTRQHIIILLMILHLITANQIKKAVYLPSSYDSTCNYC
jgi:hypothetical protein